MNRGQWMVLGVAAGLFLLLSALPKVVVEDDAVSLGAAADAQEEAASHMEPVTPAQRLAISLARKQFDQAEGEAKRSALDSLVSCFVAANRYDSAALYAEGYASATGLASDQAKAGDLFYEAFTYALSKEKAMEMGARARALYEAAMAQGGEDPRMRVKVGMTYTASESPMQGILMIRKVAEEHPENAFARKQLGLLSINSGQYEKAVGHFSRLLELEQDLEGLYYLGIAYVQLDRHEEAEQAFRKLKTLTDDPAVLKTADEYLAELAEHRHN